MCDCQWPSRNHREERLRLENDVPPVTCLLAETSCVRGSRPSPTSRNVTPKPEEGRRARRPEPSGRRAPGKRRPQNECDNNMTSGCFPNLWRTQLRSRTTSSALGIVRVKGAIAWRTLTKHSLQIAGRGLSSLPSSCARHHSGLQPGSTHRLHTWQVRGHCERCDLQI